MLQTWNVFDARSEATRSWSQIFRLAERPPEDLRIRHKELIDDACKDLLNFAITSGLDIYNVTRIVSSSYNWQRIASLVNNLREKGRTRELCLTPCQFSIINRAELCNGDPGNAFGGTRIRSYDRVLIVEDFYEGNNDVSELITRAILEIDATPIPLILTGINLSGLNYAHTHGRAGVGPKIVSLVNLTLL